MSLRTSTYTHYGKTLAEIQAEFSNLGFTFNAPEKVTHTLLDTFDGRLNEEGLRLDFRNGAETSLTLNRPKAAPLRLATDAAPRFWQELPPCKLRKQIAKITDIRAMLPQAAISVTETRATWRNTDGDTVAMVTLFQDMEVEGHKNLELPQWIAEIEIDERFTAYEVQTLIRRTKLERANEDLLSLCIRAAGINLEGFRSSTDIPLESQSSAVDGFRAVLANLSDAIAANWQGTIDQLDPEFLHNLRVAIRRTRAVLRQGRSVLPPGITEQARERFAWLGAVTGASRDFDVFLIEWDDYTRVLSEDVVAALEPMRNHIEQKRQRAYAELVPKLKSRKTTDFLAKWRTWLRTPLQNAPLDEQEDHVLGKIVANRIARAQSRLIKDGRVITPETPCEQVHDLRKEAKKVRYLLECFASLLPSDKQRSFVRRLKAFQDILGKHQDAAVHVEELRALAHELQTKDIPVDTMLAIGQLIEQLDQRRKAARAAFAKGFELYDSKTNRKALESMLDQIQQ